MIFKYLRRRVCGCVKRLRYHIVLLTAERILNMIWYDITNGVVVVLAQVFVVTEQAD